MFLKYGFLILGKNIIEVFERKCTGKHMDITGLILVGSFMILHSKNFDLYRTFGIIRVLM
jgi:hypothetical protein